MKTLAYILWTLAITFAVLFAVAICTVSQTLATISLFPLIIAMAIAYQVKEKQKSK